MRGSSLFASFRCLLQHHLRQPEGDAGHIGHQHQHEEHHAVERPDLAHHLLDRDFAHGASHEQDRPHRRMAEPDAEVEHHDHAEVHGIDTEVHHHRQQDRRGDQDRGGHIHQRAEDQQQDVDQEQDHILVAGDGEEERGDLRRHLVQRHHVADAGGAGDQGHHHGDGAQRPVQQHRQILPAIVAVDEHGDQERPDAGDGAGLDRGEDAAQDAAEDDNQRDQAPQRIDGDLRGLLDLDHVALRMLVAIGDHQAQDDQREAEQQAGKHARHEQCADRNRAAGGQRVQHRVVARRHQQGLHRGGDGQVGREHPGVAGLFHLRDHHRADRRGVRDRRAGDATEEGGRDDVDNREAAAQSGVADQNVGECHQPFGHAAFGHDGAGEDEERNGEHRHLADAVRDLQHHRFQRDAE